MSSGPSYETYIAELERKHQTDLPSHDSYEDVFSQAAKLVGQLKKGINPPIQRERQSEVRIAAQNWQETAYQDSEGGVDILDWQPRYSASETPNLDTVPSARKPPAISPRTSTTPSQQHHAPTPPANPHRRHTPSFERSSGQRTGSPTRPGPYGRTKPAPPSGAAGPTAAPPTPSAPPGAPARAAPVRHGLGYRGRRTEDSAAASHQHPQGQAQGQPQQQPPQQQKPHQQGQPHQGQARGTLRPVAGTEGGFEECAEGGTDCGSIPGLVPVGRSTCGGAEEGEQGEGAGGGGEGPGPGDGERVGAAEPGAGEQVLPQLPSRTEGSISLADEAIRVFARTAYEPGEKRQSLVLLTSLEGPGGHRDTDPADTTAALQPIPRAVPRHVTAALAALPQSPAAQSGLLSAHSWLSAEVTTSRSAAPLLGRSTSGILGGPGPSPPTPSDSMLVPKSNEDRRPTPILPLSRTRRNSDATPLYSTSYVAAQTTPRGVSAAAADGHPPCSPRRGTSPMRHSISGISMSGLPGRAIPNFPSQGAAATGGEDANTGGLIRGYACVGGGPLDYRALDAVPRLGLDAPRVKLPSGQWGPALTGSASTPATADSRLEIRRGLAAAPVGFSNMLHGNRPVTSQGLNTSTSVNAEASHGGVNAGVSTSGGVRGSAASFTSAGGSGGSGTSYSGEVPVSPGRFTRVHRLTYTGVTWPPGVAAAGQPPPPLPGSVLLSSTSAGGVLPSVPGTPAVAPGAMLITREQVDGHALQTPNSAVRGRSTATSVKAALTKAAALGAGSGVTVIGMRGSLADDNPTAPRALRRDLVGTPHRVKEKENSVWGRFRGLSQE